MENKNKKNKGLGKDKTQYGEFISSYFSWISLDNQKEKADELSKITKKEEKDDI